MIDFSFIRQTPFKKDITTKQITKQDFNKLLEHIKKEIKNKHQIIIVYPLVQASEKINYLSLKEAKDYWIKNFKNVYITSGQDKNKESILQEFREKGDILLATTVVEVGISLPNLSTIVIVGADRLGFASLHQLRGRVSRSGLKGYCFLYSNNNLPRLEEFCSINNGFDIAQLDLKYRQSGDIINGQKQSGKTFYFIDLRHDEEILKKVSKIIIH
jgi:ATP-dependent DNA helicase RecG